ncbi:hypothetical protein SELR_01650 [Selenomonas ruminantium subsp. lactilytica TAM6421]|uniref:Uncharacterized protein n=1 Tax=Selenomonas ruminantium subsp. lactilytica (strain NBRC 103574 / TAM6421) TaxID=927704 RepID=I0GM86_SELRL|nr:hypothetical protein SELR_01650 [Selenomonas ruminantium subsp. lactilytica TAM6421]
MMDIRADCTPIVTSLQKLINFCVIFLSQLLFMRYILIVFEN